MTKQIYKTFEQWMDGNFLEVKEPRKKAYSKDELLLVEMGWKYGYDAGRAVEQALDKKAENARELGLDYEPVATLFGSLPVYDTTPSAAQRQFVGLTDEERDDLLDNYITAEGRARAIEAKLREKNT